MARPIVFMVTATIVLALVAFVLGLGAERLGNWIDGHPEHGLLAWSLWNGAVVIVAVAGAFAWRRYRRAMKGQSATPAA
jgi:cytochrome c-type biogenesis protein CcmH/NrfF